MIVVNCFSLCPATTRKGTRKGRYKTLCKNIRFTENIKIFYRKIYRITHIIFYLLPLSGKMRIFAPKFF